MVIPKCWFDGERCAKGIHALRHYRRQWNEEAQAWRASPVHDHASHGCLTGDALVLTDKGLCRIDSMRAGARVWTPAGYALVEWAGLVKRAASLIEIGLADGRKLRCTPEHKIATKRGFVRADAIRYLDTVVSGIEWQSLLIGLCSRARSIGYRAAITDAINGASQGRQTFIARFGNTITGLCRKAASFITETATLSTMRCITWNVSMPRSINGCTPWSDGREENSKTPMNFVASAPPSGTDRRKASDGTSSTASGNGKTGGGLTFLANSAVRYLLLRFRSGRSGVISIVRWKTCASAEGGPLVYDLTVKNHACYQANGFLVSNSDAMRYLALGIRDGESQPLAPKPIELPMATGQWDKEPSRSGANWMRI
jgi:hypothetical protein